jgi:co-chaperonin GroES (HSP10)
VKYLAAGATLVSYEEVAMARARSGRVAPDRSTPVADIRVGDTIVYSKYGGQAITIGGEELVILNARDVVAVANLAA